jgi:hypothetical protein
MSSKKKTNRVDNWIDANRWFSYLEGKIGSLNKKIINNEVEIRKQKDQIKFLKQQNAFFAFILTVIIATKVASLIA